MKQSKWNPVWRAFKREQRHILHDKNVLAVILLAPLFYAFFYGSIYLHKSEQNVAIVVWDQDGGPWSRELIRHLDSHPLIRVTGHCQDLQEGLDAIAAMSAYGLVVIPRGAERELNTDRSITVVVHINSIRFLVSNDISKAVNEVVLAESDRLTGQWLQKHNSRHPVTTPLTTDIRACFNPGDSYGDFLIPGLIVMILQQTMFIGLAETVAKEREQGSLSYWLSSAGGSVIAAVIGKGLFYFVLFCGYAAVFLTIHFPLFHLPMLGGWLLLSLLTMLFLACVVVWSILISTFFKSKLIAMQCAVLTSYPVFLMSGFSWPIWSMPAMLRMVAQGFPTTPYLHAFGRISQMGAGFSQVGPELLHLLLLLLLGYSLLYLRLSRLSYALADNPQPLL